MVNSSPASVFFLKFKAVYLVSGAPLVENPADIATFEDLVLLPPPIDMFITLFRPLDLYAIWS